MGLRCRATTFPISRYFSSGPIVANTPRPSRLPRPVSANAAHAGSRTIRSFRPRRRRSATARIRAQVGADVMFFATLTADADGYGTLTAAHAALAPAAAAWSLDRNIVGSGKRLAVRVGLGVGRNRQNKNNH